MSDIKRYWDSKVNSGNRQDDEFYLTHKAIEQTSIIKEYSIEYANIIDIGCGAGELLKYLVNSLLITSALDYSESMLDKAATKVSTENINLICDNALKYLPNAVENVWISTGSLGQYLNLKEIESLMKIFIENNNANTLILFDTIDPIRYSLITCGISYDKSIFLKKNEYFKNIFRIALSLKRRILTSFSLIAFQANINTTIKLNSASMGYAHTPILWHHLAKRYNISVDIISSRYFEYRYHVIFNKKI